MEKKTFEYLGWNNHLIKPFMIPAEYNETKKNSANKPWK